MNEKVFIFGMMLTVLLPCVLPFAFNVVPVNANLTEVYSPTDMDPYFTMNAIVTIDPLNPLMRVQIMRFMAQNLADVGVEVYLHLIEWAEVVNRTFFSGKLFDEGGYDVSTHGRDFSTSPEVYPSTASAIAQMMHAMYHSSNILGSGGLNLFMWNNTENDALLDAAVASTNEAETESLLYEWQVLFHEEQPSAIVCYEMHSFKGFSKLDFNMLHPVFGTGIDTPLGEMEPLRAAEAAKYVRQAISHTIDREWFVLNLLTEWQPAEPGITPILPDWPGFNPSLEPYSLNLTEAKRLLRLAGYALCTDLNKDGTVNIVDITIVAVAWSPEGTTPENPNWNPTADVDKNGIINIIDIATVARDYGKTT